MNKSKKIQIKYSDLKRAKEECQRIGQWIENNLLLKDKYYEINKIPLFYISDKLFWENFPDWLEIIFD